MKYCIICGAPETMGEFETADGKFFHLPPALSRNETRRAAVITPSRCYGAFRDDPVTKATDRD